MKILDQKAADWRMQHRKQVLPQIQSFLEKVGRKSGSRKSVERATTGMMGFCSYTEQLPDELLERIKREDVYKIIDGYVSWMVKVGFAPNSIKNNVSVAKKWLGFNDVEISKERFNAKVEMPAIYTKTEDRAPTPEEFRRLVRHANIRGAALFTMLASSGLRIGEVLSLRVRDIDFEKRPATIHLRPEVTKSRKARYVFISDEASDFLKEHLGKRIGNAQDYVFQTSSRGRAHKMGNVPMTFWNADKILSVALKATGLEEKDENGRDVLHIHSFRKFFFSQMVPVLGRELTEALMGHRRFQDSAYLRLTEDKMAEQYRGVMHAVSTAPGPGQVQVDVATRHSLLKMAGYSDEQIDEMQKVAARLKPKDADVYWGNTFRDVWSSYVPDWAKNLPRFSARILQPSDRLDVKESASPRVTQVVVLMKEVEKLIAQGYTFVAPLNGDKAVLKVPEGLD